MLKGPWYKTKTKAVVVILNFRPKVDATIVLVRKVMTEAPLQAADLSVPRQVDVKAAQNWDEAH